MKPSPLAFQKFQAFEIVSAFLRKLKYNSINLQIYHLLHLLFLTRYLSHPENRIEIQKNINELKKKRNIFRKFKTFIFTHLKNCNTFFKNSHICPDVSKKTIFQFQKAATFADQFKKYDNFLREKQDEHCGLKKYFFRFKKLSH